MEIFSVFIYITIFVGVGGSQIKMTGDSGVQGISLSRTMNAKQMQQCESRKV